MISKTDILLKKWLKEWRVVDILIQIVTWCESIIAEGEPKHAFRWFRWMINSVASTKNNFSQRAHFKDIVYFEFIHHNWNLKLPHLTSPLSNWNKVFFDKNPSFTIINNKFWWTDSRNWTEFLKTVTLTTKSVSKKIPNIFFNGFMEQLEKLDKPKDLDGYTKTSRHLFWLREGFDRSPRVKQE